LMFIARLYLTLPWFVFVGLMSKRAGVLWVWLVFLVGCYISYKIPTHVWHHQVVNNYAWSCELLT
jgi:hypothetical protein